MSEILRLEYECTDAERREAQSLSLRQQLGGGSKWLTMLVLLIFPKRVFPSESWQSWFRAQANKRPDPKASARPELSVTTQTIFATDIRFSFRLGFRDYLDRTLASWRTWGIIFLTVAIM